MCAVVVPRSAYGPLNLSTAVNLLRHLRIPSDRHELCDSRGSCLFRIAPKHFPLVLALFAVAGIEHYPKHPARRV
jgi:hypothetical protein